MGSIADCKAAGIPASLLIPIRPWDAPDPDGKNAGKAPSVVNNNGEWVRMKNWQRGVLPEEMDLADQFGCNAGLILGSPDAANDAQWNFAAIDIDLNEFETTHRDRIVHAFAMAWPDQPLLIRETVPHRALLLVRITNTMSIGRKAVYRLMFKDPKDGDEREIGKLEVLATGQQAVIAGRHHSGNAITWRTYGQEQGFRAPVVNGAHDIPLPPAFPSFADLSEAVTKLLNSLVRVGYRFESRGSGGGEAVPEENLAPSWLTVEKLCALIDRMPNPADAGREMYVEVMMAVAAAKCGIARHRGELSDAMNTLVATTAAKWAAKWPNPHLQPGENPFEAELAKWENDWSRYTGDFHTSWTRLVTLAVELGVKDAPAETAQEEFTADPEPPPAKALAPVDADELPMTAPRPGEVLTYVSNSVQADFTVVNWLRRERSMDQQTCWVAATDTWMSWDHRAGWVAKDTTRATIEFMVMQELTRYTAQHQGDGTPEAWKRSEVSHMMSVGKMERVVRGLSRCVAVGLDDINNNPGYLQTPNGMFDLRTLEALPSRVRWQMKDTRRTATTPMQPGPTPLFDSLLAMLADNNPEVIEWLWHYFGYAMIGDPKAQCFLVLWGAGGNGKGTLVKVLEHIFGDYCTALDNKVLLESGKNSHPTELNMIRHKRLATVAEMPKDERWNESILKKLTGEDKIQARNMRENASSFQSQAALIIHCNELPAFSRITPAILRRFRMVGTMNRPTKADPLYADKIIQNEAGAVMAKIMLYAKRVLENGIALPDLPGAMEAQQSEALSANDQFFAWLHSECETGPTAADFDEPLDDLKARYEMWLTRHARENGEFVADKVNDKTFKQMLRDRGVRVENGSGKPIVKLRKSPQGVPLEYRVAEGIRLKVKAA